MILSVVMIMLLNEDDMEFTIWKEISNDNSSHSFHSQVTEENPDPATTLLTFLRYQNHVYTIYAQHFDYPEYKYDIVTPTICFFEKCTTNTD